MESAVSSSGFILGKYHAQFKAAVVKHIKESLDSDEWFRLRAMAENRARYVNRNDVPDLKASPECLVDVAMSEDDISVKQTLAVPGFKAVAITQIDGAPVYYVKGEGIYLWGMRPDSFPTLMLWVTHPAYPPGW